jgi:GNAT superfamily N-acetyltransferase
VNAGDVMRNYCKNNKNIKNKGASSWMIIRDYRSQDLESLTELMADLGYPTILENMRRRIEKIQSNPMYFTFVAEINREIVGMIGARQLYSYEVDEVVTQISALVTKKEFRNRGIGRALVNFIEEWAITNDSEIIVLTSGIKENRLKAHEFYKSIGFDITGYRFVKKIKRGL